MADNYKTTVFGPNTNGDKYCGNLKKAFSDMIPDLIRDGIIEDYANVDNFTDENYVDIEYGSGGPSALSKM